jgi:SAM-dependent methyltransferase
MTVSHTPGEQRPPQTRKVSIQERSVHVGEFVVVNGYHVNRAALTQRFLQGGYQRHETPHFLLFTRAEAPSTILVHWFAPEEITADLSHYLVQELKPFQTITSSQHLDDLFAGIVGGALFPGDVRRAWNYFGANTLQRLLAFLGTATPPALPDYATLGAAATLYQRVCELGVGDRFLDVGCKGGFLSLLLAQRRPFLVEAVGVDLDATAFGPAQELAAERHLSTVRFVQADVLADAFSTIGPFDTVTLLHVLEHIAEADTPRVLTNLLKVTAHRLIIAVPYEQEPEVAYGHLQVFSHDKLQRLGAWCLEHLQGAGRIWCEDLLGGLLLVERWP